MVARSTPIHRSERRAVPNDCTNSLFHFGGLVCCGRPLTMRLKCPFYSERKLSRYSFCQAGPKGHQIRARTKSESGAVSWSVFQDSAFFPAAFGVLERNLL